MTQAATQLENGLPRLFEPNTLLPSQFFTALQRRSARTPEQRLMFAILFDAVSVYCRERDPATSKERRLLRETQRWITNNDRTWVFSFLRICDALDLDASYIRRGLRELRDKSATLKAQWQAEKSAIMTMGKVTEEIEAARATMADAERRGDLQKAAEVRYGTLLELDKRLAAENARLLPMAP